MNYRQIPRELVRLFSSVIWTYLITFIWLQDNTGWKGPCEVSSPIFLFKGRINKLKFGCSELSGQALKTTTGRDLHHLSGPQPHCWFISVTSLNLLSLLGFMPVVSRSPAMHHCEECWPPCRYQGAAVRSLQNHLPSRLNKPLSISLFSPGKCSSPLRPGSSPLNLLQFINIFHVLEGPKQNVLF